MKWIKIIDYDYPLSEELLVVKHWRNQEWDMENGGYKGPYFDTPSVIQFDISRKKGSWDRFGGIATHYQRVKLPDDVN